MVRWLKDLMVFCSCLITTLGCAANFTDLHFFAGPTGDGSQSRAPLTLVGGTLYGITLRGGPNSNNGTIFSIKPDGSGYTILHNFGGANVTGPGGLQNDGSLPYASTLILDSDGVTLYGTTSSGGTSGSGGVVFSYNTSSTAYRVLFNFAPGTTAGSTGISPEAPLTRFGTTLYGSTYAMGPSGSAGSGGTIFSIGTDGSNFQVLHSFDSQSGIPQGYSPVGALVLDPATLTFYGTTQKGGLNPQSGIIFSMKIDGSNFTVLHVFNGTAAGSSGAQPFGTLNLIGSTLYGTAQFGGAYGLGVFFSINTDGSNYTILHSFGASPTDSSEPLGTLLLDGNTFYGTTIVGGLFGLGTVYSINMDGSNATTLHSFNSTDGATLFAGLILVGNTFYATTNGGGTGANGVIYSLGFSPQPVTSLTGVQEKNNFGLEYELVNILNWRASTSSVVAGYDIYRDGVKIATVDASTTQYQDHDRPKGVRALYSVFAVNGGNDTSVATSVIVP